MNMKENFLNFIDSVKPEKDFFDEEIPKAPNYDDKSYWAALPERDGLHNLSPDNKPSKEIKNFGGLFRFIWEDAIGLLV